MEARHWARSEGRWSARLRGGLLLALRERVEKKLRRRLPPSLPERSAAAVDGAPLELSSSETSSSRSRPGGSAGSGDRVRVVVSSLSSLPRRRRRPALALALASDMRGSRWWESLVGGEKKRYMYSVQVGKPACIFWAEHTQRKSTLVRCMHKLGRVRSPFQALQAEFPVCSSGLGRSAARGLAEPPRAAPRRPPRATCARSTPRCAARSR